jgi:coiled-coil domain-containing protein 130
MLNPLCHLLTPHAQQYVLAQAALSAFTLSCTLRRFVVCANFVETPYLYTNARSGQTMSSLAAARADNFYYPPEWTPQMGGISKFQGSKGKNQYEQHGIIRFELPFDAWCLGCGTHMTKGLRFNAKKEKDGKYFTTQIWAFTMKCFSCEQRFVIKTDPQNATYDMAEGIRKHEQDFTPDVDDSLIVATSDETKQLIATDPMFRLQHVEEDKQKTLSAKERMVALMEVQDAQFKDYYDANSLLRNKNRKRKKRDIELKNEGAARGLAFPLLEPSQQDSDAAKEVVFKRTPTAGNFAATERLRLSNIQAQSIFDRPAAAGSGAGSKDKCNSARGSSSARTHSSENRLVVHSSSKAVGKLTAAQGSVAKSKPVVLDGAGRYSDNARLLSKANSRKIDVKHLKLGAVPPAVASTAGFGQPITTSSAPATDVVTVTKRAKLSATTGTHSQGTASSSVLDLLSGY